LSSPENASRKTLDIPVIGLIATLPRIERLVARAIPSIIRQTASLDALVVVADTTPIPASIKVGLTEAFPLMPFHFLSNVRARGVAGSWNTGIRFISEHWPEAYLAILDDDDEWDAEHIQTCLTWAASTAWPDVVVSGLRIDKQGNDLSDQPPYQFKATDFLAGNPGWQGSNTFIRLTTLLKAGCFTDGLLSCNDRDLAYRVLSIPGIKMVFTGKHTATWYLAGESNCLSSTRGEAKRIGLAQFFQLYGDRMDQAIRQRFFDRALALFGWSETEILSVLDK
jgi:hypothetical protein